MGPRVFHLQLAGRDHTGDLNLCPPDQHLVAVTGELASRLKVHKNENIFGFDLEFCTFSMLVMHK
jgi:hypothetical protein